MDDLHGKTCRRYRKNQGFNQFNVPDNNVLHTSIKKALPTERKELLETHFAVNAWLLWSILKIPYPLNKAVYSLPS